MAIRVVVHADKQAASVAVAATIRDLIRRRQAEGRTAVLGLATGSTPLPLYAELVRLHRAEGLSFRNVVTFNLDEYEGLTGDRPESYRYFMEEHLFRHLDLRPGSTHVPDGVAADQARACAAYEEAIRLPADWTSRCWASDVPATSASTNLPRPPPAGPAASTSMT